MSCHRIFCRFRAGMAVAVADFYRRTNCPLGAWKFDVIGRSKSGQTWQSLYYIGLDLMQRIQMSGMNG